MGQLDSEIVDVPSLELVGVVSTPSTHYVEAEQSTGVITYDIIEESIFESHTITIATTVQGTDLSRRSTTQTVVDQFIEER